MCVVPKILTFLIGENSEKWKSLQSDYVSGNSFQNIRGTLLYVLK